MNHPELFQKFAKSGVQGSPCRGLGCPQILLFPLSPPVAASKKREKGFLGTPQTPAEGGCPLHSRWQSRYEEQKRLLKIRDESYAF